MQPFASLSIDLDDRWTYLKLHGQSGWEDYPSYLETVVPRVLELLRRKNLAITFFVTGQDASFERNGELLRSIAAAGHEIGNHSFAHDPRLPHFTSEAALDDIGRAEAAIEAATGQLPCGFRSPGYSVSRTVLEVLAQRGYLYDASTLPTFVGPLARTFYFMRGRLSEQERSDHHSLFGDVGEVLRPLHSYLWQTDVGTLFEIPVTTMPLVRIPFHLSYVHYAGLRSHAFARWYFRAALALCAFTRTTPSLLLHPLDFLGLDDCADLDFFPSMRVPAARKLALTEALLDDYAEAFTIVPLNEHARLTAANQPGRIAPPGMPRLASGS